MQRHANANDMEPTRGMFEFADSEFKKSTFSGTGNCVSVATGSQGSVQVRDTKDASKQTLSFTRSEWIAFVKGVKNGEFDH